MSEVTPARRPTICLNMIVRNEAHVVHEVLDSVAPFISSWVIVDTGSNDGTQDKIRNHMAALGIPGELHERRWRDFGHNRSEAISLARGHADYIWVIDADDLLIGTPDFSNLTADVYQLLYGPDVAYWRRQLFRDGLQWRYVGVLHEYADCDTPYSEERLYGDYHIRSRRLGGRNLDPEKYLRDAEVLLAEMQRHPDDSRSAFYLAQSYYDYGDFVNARQWYTRRAEMVGFEEETYYAMARVGDTMSQLGEPWAEVQDAYLRAWEYRPWRAEPLYAIARCYRLDERYRLGYLFAERAACIPLPEQDVLFVAAEVYQWRALDEQAVCASWVDKHQEAVDICRRIGGRDDVPMDDLRRIMSNRDCSAPMLYAAATAYPEVAARNRVAGPRDSEVTATLVAGPDRAATERGLNSFLNCCSDADRVGRVMVIDIGLSVDDRALLGELYPFLEFRAYPNGLRPNEIRAEIGGRFWLYLGMGWQFFTSDDYVGRLTSVLDAEPDVYQVGVNLEDADKLTGAVAPREALRRRAGAGGYLLSATPSVGPAMFDCVRWDGAETSLGTATLDEVLCILQA